MKDRLYRSRKERVLGGVCGGLAEYFDIDPIIVRILFVILGPTTGIGLLVYIVMWVAVPEEDIQHYYARFAQNPNQNPFNNSSPNPNLSTEPGAEPDNSAPKQETPDYSPEMMKEYLSPKKRGSGSLVFGTILVLLGILFLFWIYIPSFDFSLIFPIIFVVIGATLIFNSIRK
jgi:phage shock protein PspC (stress-responsive transcriptional regulator)